jgi:penicillin-binding protein 1A
LPGWQAGGKTGTSQDFRDAWFIGYTSRLVAGVWLGNDDSSPTKRVSGGNLPVEIWSRFMKTALQNTPVAALPLGTWRPASPLAEAVSPLAPILDLFSPSQEPPDSAPASRADAAGRGRPYPPLQGQALLPPEDIPAQGSKRAPARTRPRQEKNFFEQLFGG